MGVVLDFHVIIGCRSWCLPGKDPSTCVRGVGAFTDEKGAEQKSSCAEMTRHAAFAARPLLCCAIPVPSVC